MPESYSRKQVVMSYGQTVQVLDEMVRKNFSEWSQNLDGQYLKRLEQPLLVRCKDKTAKLDINFDKWVTQTRLTHKRHEAFTLEYTFTQCLTYCFLCTCDTHKPTLYNVLTIHPCPHRRYKYTLTISWIHSYALTQN